MRQKEILILNVLILLTLNYFNPALSFSNCQIKYDSDKRSLPSLRGMCNVCHLSASGSGPQNEFGRAFAKAGFMITDDLVVQFPEFFQKPKEPSASTSSSGDAILPTPKINRVKPNKFKTNVQSMISITGKNFVNGAKALIDNNEVLTTFKSKIMLIADFILNSTGTHELRVKNPDGQESSVVKIMAK